MIHCQKTSTKYPLTNHQFFCLVGSYNYVFLPHLFFVWSICNFGGRGISPKRHWDEAIVRFLDHRVVVVIFVVLYAVHALLRNEQLAHCVKMFSSYLAESLTLGFYQEKKLKNICVDSCN